MRGLLKFITCGSVDDGKSTLIGHMLYDSKLIFTDQEKALELDSKVGSVQGSIDYALLLDGLMAEREQGITIDVAYRYFTTVKRSFIVADCPGHEQYTRNMAVGASFADLAVVLVDASKGVLTQTKRHARICSMMGIKHFVIAVNKMDLIGYDKSKFDEIKRDVKTLCSEFELKSLLIIPVSATVGDNLTTRSNNTLWYQEKTLFEYLEDLDIENDVIKDEFVLPVQRVCRPNHTFRGFQGQVELGRIKVGDELIVLPSHEKAKVDELYLTNRSVNEVIKGQPVTVTLDREIDISRGSVLTRGSSTEVADKFTSTILWMDDENLVKGRNYILKCGTKLIPATVMDIKYKLDINSGDKKPTDKLFKNEIAVVDIALTEKIVLDKFSSNKSLGGFILIDRLSNMTSACGVIEHTLRRSTNVVWQKTDVSKEIRSNMKNQKPLTIWFTGLSGSGKSTIANELEKRLVSLGKHTMLLDGDNVRQGLNKNLGFKEVDRIENIRRISEVASLFNDAGLIVLTAFISPFEQDREQAREIIGNDFFQIYVSTPLSVCEARDVKGLYAKAHKGEIPNFTGISSPYEVPVNPDMTIDTSTSSIDDIVDNIMKVIESRI